MLQTNCYTKKTSTKRSATTWMPPLPNLRDTKKTSIVFSIVIITPKKNTYTANSLVIFLFHFSFCFPTNLILFISGKIRSLLFPTLLCTFNFPSTFLLFTTHCWITKVVKIKQNENNLEIIWWKFVFLASWWNDTQFFT